MAISQVNRQFIIEDFDVPATSAFGGKYIGTKEVNLNFKDIISLSVVDTANNASVMVGTIENSKYIRTMCDVSCARVVIRVVHY